MNIKAVLKEFIPPIAYKLVPQKKWERDPVTYHGNFDSWEQARSETTGYDSDVILEKCKQSLLKVKNGEAKQERDSGTFDEITYSWPLLAALQHVAISNGNSLSLIDFGGSLGSSYYQNKEPLENLKSLNWTIVEQEHFVDCGNINFKNEQLTFEYTIESALDKRSYHTVVLSGVPQYLENIVEFVDKLIGHNIEYIILDRVSFIEDAKRIAVQIVPEWIYNASYPTWLFNEAEFLNLFLGKYDLIYDFSSKIDEDEVSDDGKRMYWKGFFLKLKKAPHS